MNVEYPDPESCKGCYTYEHQLGCDGVVSPEYRSLCPCSTCLVKFKCNNICEVLDSFIQSKNKNWRKNGSGGF